jgi:F-type H+-transporting ATPase subunit alpha
VLSELLDTTSATLAGALRGFSPGLRIRETGTVTHVGGPVARIKGLPGLMAEELVELRGGPLGIAVDLEAREVGVILLGDTTGVVAGAEARATGRLADTPVGYGLLGRVLDATGRTLDERGRLRSTERWLIERDAPAIIDRAPVTVPLQTGLKVVDALIPIGRGQRELILGDRQTGKTTLAVDAILNQRGNGVICVYCAIGQRGTAVARVIDTLRANGALDYSVVMVAAGEDPPGLQYITPYAATTVAEYFMHRGDDVLIVYDDLTRHARAYRELSLLLRRPPGREAYPGDIFYLHSRLLERATHLAPARGGGSITALPIAETQAQDIAAYIPTNLISITDGQIYLSPDLFHKGMLPAVDVAKSVSRVGGKTQLPAYRKVAGPLRLAHAQFEELETFSRFATRLDDDTRAIIERGRRVSEVLRQGEHRPLPPAAQIAVLRAASVGMFDGLRLDEVPWAERAIREASREALPEVCQRIDRGEEIPDEAWAQLQAVAAAALHDTSAARTEAR